MKSSEPDPVSEPKSLPESRAVSRSRSAVGGHATPGLHPANKVVLPPMRWVDRFTHLLDTKFRIPGTSIRFGGDFLLGLVPGAGDGISLVMSGLLIATMAKNGASFRLVLRMLGNVVVDAIVGTVPLAGNVFDLFFKANTRNLALMREYYEQGKHTGRSWPVIVAILAVILTVFIALFLLIAWLLKEVWQFLF
ncbi:protein of unknown function [Neorhodopirellula lusitana]|uniref:DUF4112 domain-containing protein n=1 Tax=Neorhodopirellula lusitana TaxID=445327 RepID=A0ABY1PUL6_9BACT|nr:protein of unknown function [Neorhodopirellula lusitana]